jgi:nicotinamidase-related amidase
MVLVIVDVQERLAKVMERRDQVVSAINVLVRLAKLHDIPIILTQQYTRGLGPTVEPILEELGDDQFVEKVHFSCCGHVEFTRSLDGLGRKTVLLTGMETHICVLQTCLDLLDADYNVHVPWDAVCSRSDGNRDMGLKFMERAGAVLTSSETAAFQVLVKAGTPEFKEISSLLK